MKNRTVQAVSIGLSAITLSGPVSLNVYAQTIDSESEGESDTEQIAQAEDDTSLKVETIAQEACDATEKAEETTFKAAENTAATFGVLESDETISQEEAQQLLDDTSKTVENAETDLNFAEEKYNQLLSEYEEAKAQYQVAVDNYNNQKQEAQSSLQDAEADLEEAKVKLEELQQELSDEKYTVYEYADSDGQLVKLSKEEAEQSDGKVELESYWTIDGTYVPTYVDYMRYHGTRTGFYTSQEAIESGKEYVDDLYYNDPEKYKTSVEYNDDWTTDSSLLGLIIDTTGTFTATYNKTAEKDGYQVSQTVKDSHYSSEKDAVDAVEAEAKELHGAARIDKEESNLISTNVKKYAEIIKRYFSAGEDEKYDSLLNDVEQAKADCQTAQDKVQSIQDQISALKDDDSILALVQVTFLEAKLEVATASYNHAKENLAEANSNLEKAKTVFSEKYTQPAPEEEPTPSEEPGSEEEPTPAQAEPAPEEAPAPAEETTLTEETNPKEDPELLEELDPLEEELKIKEEITKVIEKEINKRPSSGSSHSEDYPPAAPAQEEQKLPEQPDLLGEISNIVNPPTDNSGSGSDSDSGFSVPDINQLQEESEEPTESVVLDDENVQIPDPATPKDVTVKGLMEHKKWFVGLAGVSACGAGIGVVEAKRRAVAKIIDKLNQ